VLGILKLLVKNPLIDEVFLTLYFYSGL